ncbi:MAG: redox-regulated ATPase YchF [Candidatus Aenigmatarchaeota archaeon]
MQVGLVGAPNSGKSTFLKAASLADVEIGNYPFTTIDANRGIGYVTVPCPCRKRNISCDPQNSECKDGTRLVPVKLLDVAGLVPDAHKGKGLGNQFLDDLREADALIHVLDVSGRTNAKGEKTEDYDPKGNIEFLEEELDKWFIDIFEREWQKFASEIEMEHRDFEDQLLSRFSGLKIDKNDIRTVLMDLDLNPEKPSTWNEENREEFCRGLRKRTKPILIAANKIDLPGSEENYERIKEESNSETVACCAEAELALREAAQHGLIDYTPGEKEFEITDEGGLSKKQSKALEFVEKILENYGSTGVQRCLNSAVFDLLDMIVVYPVENEHKLTDKKGNVLPDAILIEKGSTTEDLAYKIHSDIGDKFIGAIDCKTERKIGADHELENGDIVKILTSS